MLRFEPPLHVDKFMCKTLSSGKAQSYCAICYQLLDPVYIQTTGLISPVDILFYCFNDILRIQKISII